MTAISEATAELIGAPGRIIGRPDKPATPVIMSNPSNQAPKVSRADSATESADASFSLLLRAKAGDDHAREALFARYLPRVRRWAHGRLPAYSRSLLNTDDLAQEVLCRAIVSLETFEPRHEGAFQGFLRQIMVNRVRDEVRTAHRKPAGQPLEDEHVASDPSPIELAIGQESLERYEAALQRIKPQERELIVARYELDFSNEEIAALFGKPTASAARVAVGRALVRLAEEMTRG